MTVTATNTFNEFTTNGVTTDFAFDFAITDTSQVYAFTVDGDEQTDYTDFTVIQSESGEGGTLTTNSILDDVNLLIYRKVDFTQEVDYNNGGRFPAESHEQAIDKLTLQNQDQQSDLDRSLKTPIGSTETYELGDLVDGKLLEVNDGKIQSVSSSEAEYDLRQTVAVSVGTTIADVMLSTDETPIVGFIYDTNSQVTYSVPEDAQGELIVSVSGGVLTTASGDYSMPIATLRNVDVNVMDFGATVYKHGDDSFLTNPTDSLQAFINACNSTTGLVRMPEGRFALYGDGLDMRDYPCGGLVGEGYDYWEIVFQNDDNQKSDAKGTHLYLVGTGNKVHSIDNLGRGSLGEVTEDGIDFKLTDFTNNDSVDENPATAKPFSCGIVFGRNTTLQGFRILPYNNGINGYNDQSSTSLGDDWDVGVWGVGAAQSEVDIQSVGHARIAASLFTENSGYGEYGNCEQMDIKVYGQGQRGLCVRNTEQIEITSYDLVAGSITIPHRSDMTITGSGLLRITGATTNRYFTIASSTYSSGFVTIFVNETLDGTPSALRSGYTGTGWARSIFRDSRFETLEHISGNKSTSFGLDTSIAREISGFPIRGLCFMNSKSQCEHDDGNTYYGDVRDMRNLIGQYEGGYKVAFALNDVRVSNPSGYTGNLREIDTHTSDSVNEGAFNPRDCFDSYRQFDTELTSGEAVYRPWRDVDTFFKDYSGTLRFKYGSSGVDMSLTTGNNFYIGSDSISSIMSFFGGSGNAEFYNNVTINGDLISKSNVRPSVDNVGTVGDSTKGYNSIYLHDQTTGASRKVQLVGGVLVVT